MQVHPARIHALNQLRAQSGQYVLYWMQSSQRATHNEALQLAIAEADELGLPVLVVLVLIPGYPGANERHYRFMVEGWPELQQALAERGIAVACRLGEPVEVVCALARRAALVVTDCGYLRHHRAWYAQLAERLPCPLVQVEANIVVPLAAASAKEEYAARTLRPRIHRRLAEFLTLAGDVWPRHSAPEGLAEAGPLATPDALAQLPDLDRSVLAATLHGGETAAYARLRQFFEHRLERYAEARNDPGLDGAVTIPTRIWGRSRRSSGAPCGPGWSRRRRFHRELVCVAQPSTTARTTPPMTLALACRPAQRTLAEHQCDPRPHLYDVRWGRRHARRLLNAAQHELVLTGQMHGYMRMYGQARRCSRRLPRSPRRSRRWCI